MAKILASKGLLVTFSTNLSSGNMMSMAGGGSSSSGSTGVGAGEDIPVGDGLLRFEFFDDGTDMAVDALDVFVPKLGAAGPAALEDIIRRNAGDGRPVKHIVGDPFLPWVAGVADRMGIRWSLLWVPSFTVFSIYYRYFRSPELFPSDDGGWAGFEAAFPGLPLLKTDEVPGLLFPTDRNRCLREVMMDTLANLSPATWALFETFEELESPAFAAADPLLPPPANFLPVGPLAKHAGSLVGPAGDLYQASDEVVEWLDGQPAGSVLYVAFGSVAALPPGSVAELAGGLRESGRRFLWAVKPARGASETGVPAGFEAEVGGRGMVVRWCPQEKVLALRVELDVGGGGRGEAGGGAAAVRGPAHQRQVPGGGVRGRGEDAGGDCGGGGEVRGRGVRRRGGGGEEGRCGEVEGEGGGGGCRRRVVGEEPADVRGLYFERVRLIELGVMDGRD